MDLKCPFRATIMTRNFACSHACEITRREGPDIGCDSEEFNEKCNACFSELKNRALPEMGYNDDLTEMPASVVQKIQFGGLLALQASTKGTANNEKVENISALIKTVYDQYGDINQIPYEQCLESIKSYKLKRRRGR